jgi:putative RecB family exonuclease
VPAPSPRPTLTPAAPEQLALPLTGIRKLFACTPSRLGAFDCPRRYRLTYVERPAPKGPPWAHNTVGAVVHLALHRWWTAPRPARTIAHAGTLVERNWTEDGFRDPEQSALWRHRARQWVESYVAGLDPDDEPLGVERTVAAKTDGLAISGRADRIDDRNGELAIVDYKTGRQPLGPDDARSSLALAMYAIGARRTFRRSCLKVELHHLPTGTVAAYEHTEATLSRHVGRAESRAQDIVAATDIYASGADADEVFPPAPGPGCSWCDVRRHCLEGRCASIERRSWDGLADTVQ